MSRSDPRHVTHVREDKPAVGRPGASLSRPEEKRRPEEEALTSRGWSFAALLLAGAFLFLAALMVSDLVAALFRG